MRAGWRMDGSSAGRYEETPGVCLIWAVVWTMSILFTLRVVRPREAERRKRNGSREDGEGKRAAAEEEEGAEGDPRESKFRVSKGSITRV
jgi:hypothetical protein